MDVQFLGADGDGLGTSDEELDTRPPRRQGLLVVIATAVVALAVAGVALERHSDGGDAATAPTTQPPSVAVTVAGEPGAGQPLFTLDNDTPAVVIDGAVVTIAGGALTAVDPADGKSLRRATLPGAPARYALVGDARNHRIWLVRLAPATLLLAGYESHTLELEMQVEVPAHASGAAVLGGRLFVDTDTRVFVAAATPDRSIGPTQLRGGVAIAADPTRNRLLLLDLDSASADVRAVGARQARALAVAKLPFGKGDVQVAGGGQIWAAGYGPDGTVLVRLDPRTLRPTLHSVVEDQQEPGAVIAAAGRRALLVRSGSDSAVWCVDATTGAVVHSWSEVAGAVALGPDGVLALDAVGTPPARLSGPECS